MIYNKNLRCYVDTMNKCIANNMLYHELHWGPQGARILTGGRGPLAPLETAPERERKKYDHLPLIWGQNP